KYALREFVVNGLPIQGKLKPNGEQEKRGRQRFLCSIRGGDQEHQKYLKEFGLLVGDTVVCAYHESDVIKLVEQLTKCIIVIMPIGRQLANIETSLNRWLGQLPKNLFKSIIFDCGKEFSNWKNISNKQDINIYFADPGTPSQRGLNEHANGLLRRNG